MKRAGPHRPDVIVGRITGVHGIKGWLKVYSYTRDRLALLDYRPWHVTAGGNTMAVNPEQGRLASGTVLVKLEGMDDRDSAATWVGAEIAVPFAELPAPEPGEYYWYQLQGLAVVNRQGVELGTVDHLLETGANDVLVVTGERERLIPYLPSVILQVDEQAGRLEVDWDADF